MSAPTDRPNAPGGGVRRGPANIVLVGLSGSGKTTVGRLLAKRLGWRFVDTDREIQRVHGQDSELCELWQEGDEFDAWKHGLDGIAASLR